MSANEHQVGGDHYAEYGELQPWDVIAAFDLDFFLGNVFKYMVRDKEGEDDVERLLKARHYLDKRIELLRAARGEVWGVSMHADAQQHGLS